MKNNKLFKVMTTAIILVIPGGIPIWIGCKVYSYFKGKPKEQVEVRPRADDEF